MLALKETINFGLKKFGFKLTKKIVTEFNYKEKGLLDFQVTRFRPLLQKWRFWIFPHIGDLTFSYPPNWCVAVASH